MSSYKYCIVPACSNTTRTAPCKLFFDVPRPEQTRKKWCKAIRRTGPRFAPLSSNSVLHCCEDHFNLEEDTQNWMEYRLMHTVEGYKVTLRLKKDVLPHIFSWKPEATSKSTALIETVEQHQQTSTASGTVQGMDISAKMLPTRNQNKKISLLEKKPEATCKSTALIETVEQHQQTSTASGTVQGMDISAKMLPTRNQNKKISLLEKKPEATSKSTALIKRKKIETVEQHQETSTASGAVQGVSTEMSQCHKAVQVRPKYRSKAISVKPNLANAALSPIVSHSKDAATATTPLTLKKRLYEGSPSINTAVLSLPSKQGSTSSMDWVPVSDLDTSPSECSWRAEEEDRQLKEQMRSGFLKAIKKNPKMLVGIPESSYYIIDYLVKNIKAPVIDILITLKKIKLNDSFSILALHFGYSESTISRIFGKTIILLGNALRSLIIWPSKSMVVSNLPVAFRARYADVYAIIDCLEIEIEKPTNALHQSLSWSQYKGCNTAKYLIGCTPDGLVTFISEGYGGRASDVTIVKDSGFLEKLPEKVRVMADRGFKNIEHLLQQKNCTLVRPPSVSKDSPSSNEEVILSKQIAALRIHVERVISRLREFHLLLPHSRIDHQLTPVLDYIMVSACGIINLQNFLIKI